MAAFPLSKLLTRVSKIGEMRQKGKTYIHTACAAKSVCWRMSDTEAVPDPMADTPVSPPAAALPASTPASLAASASNSESKPAAKATSQQAALQQQIQAQLQSQLQAQLQAAAAKGKQANITPEMIQVCLRHVVVTIGDFFT